MANRRMFTKQIIDSDAFLDMPLSSQTLYFHLSMRADDDGFINNPRKIQRMIGASDDDLKLLIGKRFIIAFENGVIVIKHWRMHNAIRKDRYTPTQYQEELKRLTVKENGSYTENGNHLATTWQPDGNHLQPQVRLGKDRLEKNSAEPSEIKDFFESIWKEYPEKKGKSQISMTTKRKLHKVGEETLLRAIDNYKDDLRINDWKKPMNGSTFFNGRYEDYLQVEEKPEIQFLNIGDDE